MTLNITTPTLDSFMVDKRYTATAQGTVKVAGITDAGGAAVRNGVFHLFLAGREGDFYRRTMLYRLPFSGADGNRYVLEGFKDVRDHGGFDVWSATTTLYTSVYTAEGKVAATGNLAGPVPRFFEAAYDLQGNWNHSIRDQNHRIGAVLRAVYRNPVRGIRQTADARRGVRLMTLVRLNRTRMKLPQPEIIPFTTPDGVDLLLTHYKGGDKGPVMVVHGVSVWSGMFTVPWVRENFARIPDRPRLRCLAARLARQYSSAAAAGSPWMTPRRTTFRPPSNASCHTPEAKPYRRSCIAWALSRSSCRWLRGCFHRSDASHRRRFS